MSIPPDKSPDRISPGKTPEPIGQPNVPSKGADFDSYMKGSSSQMPQPPSGQPPGASGVGAAGILPQGPAIATGAVSYNSLLAQAKVSQDSLGAVESQLGNQNLKLKRSQSHLVRQKLTDANSYIRAAGSKLGAPMPDSPSTANLSGISKFIAMVNDGQNQLAAVQQQLQTMASHGEQLNPGEMMAVQVKMSLAQQEIEYTSTLLGKVVQSITQIINTQL